MTVVTFTEEEFAQALADELYDMEAKSIRSFEESGLLTREAGIVIRLNNGQEFQVSVLESTR